VAAQWQPTDLATVKYMIETGRLSVSDLITHRSTVDKAEDAYRTAFDDPTCLKMILDWRTPS
jgi:3-hydroxyethyl bacteriochlorophyllide a dehydrogenase